MRSRPSAATAFSRSLTGRSPYLDALERFLHANHVQHAAAQRVTELAVADGRVTGVKTEAGSRARQTVSFLRPAACPIPLPARPATAIGLAPALGHTIVEPIGSLVPLVEKGHDCAKMQGLALKNIAVQLVNAKGKTVYEDFGRAAVYPFRPLRSRDPLCQRAYGARGSTATRSGSTSSPRWTKKRWTRAFCAIFPPRRTAILKTASPRCCRDR